ncbi:MAG TPA: ABC transporter substrate-binding protein [Pseudonocardiaceae bacterium]
MSADHIPGISRRQALRLGLALGVAGPLAAACGGGGFSTSGGGGGDGQLTFMSTQFTPVEEKERFRKILADAFPGPVNYVTNEPGPFATQVRSQVSAGRVEINLLGGIHGDLAPLADGQLEDLTDLVGELSGKGYAEDFLQLARAGTDRTWYVPWAQATYVLAAKKSTLEYLPSGADVNDLTYDQFLSWAQAAAQASGAPQLGLPAGPKGLLHRFLQGYLYPSFTGRQVTAFRSDEAVTMWEYLKELWAVTAPSSTNVDFMQEPLAAGQVTMAWDHVARLVNAPGDAPDEWIMVPAPKGPEGRGYMAVLLGLAIPKGAPDQDRTKELIKALSDARTQAEVLRQNAFFPTVEGDVPSDLPPAIQLEADAVAAQAGSADALVALPPVGLGTRDGEMSKIFKDSFTAIVLQNQDIRATLDAQGAIMQTLLDDAKVPCWAPDEVKAGETCKVG